MIQLEGVCKRYGEQLALDHASFVVPDGAVTGLVGPNGAGKSTALKIIAGVTTPTAGAALVDGDRYADAAVPGASLGTMLSAEWIPGHLTGSSYLRYVCDLYGLPAAHAKDALQLAGLSAVGSRRVRTYSLGMRQRLGIVATIMSGPHNLLLDEPINGLDPDGILWLRHVVTEAARAGKAVLISSHLMSELSMVADAIVMIVGGRVVRQAPLSSFLEGHDDRVVYIESTDLAQACRALDEARLRHEPYRSGAIVHGTEPQDVGGVVFGTGGQLSHLSVLTRSLEETYFAAVAEAGARTEEGAR